MHDLLTAHAERVASANDDHATALKAIRERADARIRERLSDFGARMVEAAKTADLARQELIQAIDEIIDETMTETAGACVENETSIEASAAAMEAEMKARAIFLETGRLPVSEQPGDGEKPANDEGTTTASEASQTAVEEPAPQSPPVDPQPANDPTPVERAA